MVIEEIGIFLLACLGLVKSSQYAVRSIAQVGRSLGISEFVISFLVVGIVSTFPEYFIGIVSALGGVADIGLGTVLGSNVADLTLIIAIIVLVGGNISVSTKAIRYDFFYLTLAALPIILALDGELSRMDGFVLVFLCAIFFYHIFQEGYHFHKVDKVKRNHALINLFIFLLSIAVLFISANYAVQYAEKLAISFLVPEIFIGLILLALSTTLPELTFGLRAVRDGHGELALGDILGNVVIDSTLVVGTIALIQPILLNIWVVASIGFFMVLGMFAVITLIEKNRAIRRSNAGWLIAIYLGYIVVNFLLQQFI
ncbi:MAG TPA: sodium:calcium antiporter [Candidatus Nanoarchaeia archaeon]|nr:sodium:calcium antiporter [Candidatus Nanoarchaeia archaeon]